jgi:hypothetical protein
MKSLNLRIMKSSYKVEDFGRGKSKVSKARHKRILKKKTKNIIDKEIKNEAEGDNKYKNGYN